MVLAVEGNGKKKSVAAVVVAGAGVSMIDASLVFVGDVDSQARPRGGRGSSGDASAVITGDRTAFCDGDILPNEVNKGETGLKAPPSAATPLP